MKTLGLAAAATIALALAACGGGGGTPPATTAGNGGTGGAAMTTGIFDVGYGRFHGTYALLDDGRYFGVHFVGGSVLGGHPYGTLSKTNSIASKDPITWVNFVNDARQVGTLETNALFGRSLIDGALRVAISSNGLGELSTTAGPAKPWGDGSTKTLYDDPIPLATLAGSYQATIRSYGIFLPQAEASAFDIDADGNVSATASGCTFSGTIKQHGRTGIYDLEWVPGGAGCKFVMRQSGIVMPVSMAGNKPSLIFMSNVGDGGQAAVFRALHK